ASATDLVQAYDLARNSDPQFASSEALRNAQQEGVVQSRAALLPQVSADVNFNHSEISSSASQARARQADDELASADDALVVRVADAYFNVLTQIETLASARAEERAVK